MANVTLRVITFLLPGDAAEVSEERVHRDGRFLRLFERLCDLRVDGGEELRDVLIVAALYRPCS